MTSPLVAAREAPWRIGLRGARANLRPGLALQLVALVLVLAYYGLPQAREALSGFSAWRVHWGVGSAMLTTAICGGLLPGIYLRITAPATSRPTVIQVVWLTAFWAYKGLEIDLWYRLLAWGVGEGHDAPTIAAKMFLDQFVYCPAFAVPLSWAAYTWAESRFDAPAVVRRVRTRGWYNREVLPMLLSNLGVWVPAVLIIYALPTPLQLPMQNLVLCFFTLILAHIAREARRG